MPIAQYTALFSLLGTTYGGNGQTNFALPDLRGRAPISSGQGPGLQSYTLGEQVGSESVTLNTSQMPSHPHPVIGTSQGADSTRPANAYLAAGGSYAATTDGTKMGGGAVGPAGGNQPHENRPPILVLNWCIALEGIFPSRN